MSHGNHCPNCGRSRGSMTHKVKCLGKSRGAERAKNRLRRANQHPLRGVSRAGLSVIAGASFGGHDSAIVSFNQPRDFGVVANGDFYSKSNAARAGEGGST